MKLKNKIFVGGLPRSGTTLVQNILDSHSEIYGGAEFDRIPNIMDLRNKLLRSLKAGRITSYTSEKKIDESIEALINSLFDGIESDKDFNLISEKTPWNILWFDELLSVFPNAKYIIVLRNPLDVFNSMKKVAINAKEKNITSPDFTTNYKTAVAYMNAVYKNSERLLKSYPDSFYVVRYENLLKNLKEETQSLCKFIDVNWEAVLLNFNSISHPGEETMTKDGIWYSKSMYSASPSEVNKNKKVTLLTFVEKSFIIYSFRNNKFINKNYCYFSKLNLAKRIMCKLINYGYQKNYHFNKTPKRILS